MPKWDEMSPRERDILVATRVMGLPEPMESPFNGKWIHHVARETYPGSGVFKEDRDRQSELRSYTTDISAAWEVVEKMQQKYTYSLSHETHWDFYQAWLENPVGDEFANANAPTMPEAVCLAALRALGVDM